MTSSSHHAFLEGPYRISGRPRPQLLAPLSKLLLSSLLLGGTLVALGLLMG